MRKNPGSNNILILAGDTDWNIGDRAIVYSTCCELKRIEPDLKISILSGRIDHDRQYFDADLICRGPKGLPAMLRKACRCKLIIIGGGGLLQDDDSMVKMPYWAARIAMLRAVNKNATIIGCSLGIGPLRKPISRLFARAAFTCMDVISARDVLGQKLASSLTSKTVHLVPDPALLLPAASRREAISIFETHHINHKGTLLIGVSLRRWFHQKGSIIPHKIAMKYGLRPIPGIERCKKMIHLMATVLDRVAECHNGTILFLPTYNVPHEADDDICLRIIEKMRTKNKYLMRIEDPRLYKSVAGLADVMLCGRMHPAIFAAAVGTNIVGLSYNQKFQGFFGLLECQDKLIGIEEFVDSEKTDQLFDIVTQAIENNKKIGAKVKRLEKRIQTFTENIILNFM